MVEERLRRALLDDFAAVQEDDTIRNRAGKLHLVGDNDHRAALLRQIEHNVQHLADHFGVKGCSHFIEQQNFRVHRQCADDGDALLLATGQLPRVASGLVQQVHAVQQGLGFLLYLVFGTLGHLERSQHNVVQHGQMREQLIALEYHADALAQTRQPLAAVGDSLIAQADAPALGGLQRVDAAQQRALAAAAGAYHHDDLAGADGKADVIQHGIFPIALDQMLYGQNRFCHGSLPPFFL